MGSWGCLFDGLGDEEEMGWGESIGRSYSKKTDESVSIGGETFVRRVMKNEGTRQDLVLIL